MTNSTTTTPETTGKKKNYTKIVFMVIGLGLALIGVDHLTLNILPIGAQTTITGKDITISPLGDSVNVKGISLPILSKTSNNGVQEVSWVGKTVIIKGTSNLNFLLQAFPGAGSFNVTADGGTTIQVNNYTSAWLNKSDFEIKN